MVLHPDFLKSPRTGYDLDICWFTPDEVLREPTELKIIQKTTASPHWRIMLRP